MIIQLPQLFRTTRRGAISKRGGVGSKGGSFDSTRLFFFLDVFPFSFCLFLFCLVFFSILEKGEEGVLFPRVGFFLFRSFLVSSSSSFLLVID